MDIQISGADFDGLNIEQCDEHESGYEIHELALEYEKAADGVRRVKVVHITLVEVNAQGEDEEEDEEPYSLRCDQCEQPEQLELPLEGYERGYVAGLKDCDKIRRSAYKLGVGIGRAWEKILAQKQQLGEWQETTFGQNQQAPVADRSGQSVSDAAAPEDAGPRASYTGPQRFDWGRVGPV